MLQKTKGILLGQKYMLNKTFLLLTSFVHWSFSYAWEGEVTQTSWIFIQNGDYM